MNIKFKKLNHTLDITLKNEPIISEGLHMGSFYYKYAIEKFSIDGEDMRNETGTPYYEYSFGNKTIDGETVPTLILEYSLAKKVSVKLGLQETNNIEIVFEGDAIKIFKNKLIPYGKQKVEEVRAKQLKDAMDMDKTITDNSIAVISFNNATGYTVNIEGAHKYSLACKDIAEKLTIYNDKSILNNFIIDTDYSYWSYKMTYKELMEIVNSIEDAVNEKKAKLEAIDKKYKDTMTADKAEIEKDKDKFEIVKQIKLVHPQGGEDGTDGFYRVIVREKETGIETDVVVRNVFDVGCWSDVYGKENCKTKTEIENRACSWVYNNTPFTTDFRM